MLNSLIVLATAVLALRANVVKDSGDEIEARIINGKEANPFSFPFVVSLQENGRHFCGGTLLNNSTVLTAAHCTDIHPNTSITVNIKRHDLRKNSAEEGGQSIKIRKQTRHPSYNKDTYQNDIAIWKLESPVTVPVSYVTLDDGKLAEQLDLPAETIGWGRINPKNNEYPSRLQHTTLPIYDVQKCNTSYNNFLSSNSQLCAGYSEGITTTCIGDSGGPLFVKEGDQFVQIGITSYGRNERCLNPGFPSVS
jgi:secreted trypsin-like serine protease